MKINGLQKLTLLDFPGHTACTVFLAGCDLRCPFCHNSDLLDGKETPVLMESDELLEFLKSRQGLLDGVAITGGEPTLRPDLPELIRDIRALGYKIKLDTNGGHPERLKALVNEGLLDYVAMDIKNSPARYAGTAGLDTLDMTPFYESIRFLKEGPVDYEFRTTVVKEFHDADSFRGIGPMIEGAKNYFLQCFTDRDTVAYEGLHAPSREELEEYRQIAAPYVVNIDIRGI